MPTELPGWKITTGNVDAVVRSVTVQASGPYAPTAPAGGGDFSKAVRMAGPQPWFDPAHPSFAGGADMTGANDSAAAVQACMTAAAAYVAGTILSHADGTTALPIGGTVIGFAGTIKINSTLHLPQGVSIVLDPNCTMKAGAVIAGPMMDTLVGAIFQEGKVEGGTWDCNGLAQNGIYLRLAYHVTVYDILIARPTAHSMILGDVAAATGSFEIMLRTVHCWRPSQSAVPAGSYGIWLSNCTDSSIWQCVIVGQEAGIRVDLDYNRIGQCHVWGYPTHLPLIAFDDNATGTEWLECISDTVATYGWRLRQNQATLIACTVFNGSSSGGSDNVVVAVHSDSGSGSFQVIGCRFAGSDGAHRIKIDIEGDLTNCHIWGNIQNNVVTANSFDQTPFIQAKTFKATGDFRRGYQNVAYAAAPTPNPALGEVFYMFLTGNVAPGAPASPQNGQVLVFDWEQDGTGGRTITYNAIFKTGGAVAIATTLSTHTIDEFVYQGAAWRLKSRLTGQA